MTLQGGPDNVYDFDKKTKTVHSCWLHDKLKL